MLLKNLTELLWVISKHTRKSEDLIDEEDPRQDNQVVCVRDVKTTKNQLNHEEK